MMALVLAIGVFSDLSLASIFSFSSLLHPDLIFILCLSFIGAAAAKSALIPLNVWLPQAMEGPTSVSALLHSSTMVTAGVFLLIRISPLLEYSSTSLMIIIWLGSLGALFGAGAGLVDNDLKKIIAFSTLSQLGYMIVAVGISQYNLALFHLLTHAFFVRRDRKYYSLDGSSFEKKCKGYKLTYLYFKFVYSLWYKRLTRVNPWKNCVIVLKIFHFCVKYI